jgi:general L-amino acid transport system substrate-binding protein
MLRLHPGRLTAALVLALLTASAPALAGKTLEAIKAKGQIACGVSTGVIGFSAADSQGRWKGHGRRRLPRHRRRRTGRPEQGQVGAAQAQQRFTALQSGEVDMLSRNTTWSLTRDASPWACISRGHLLRRPGLPGAEEAQGHQREAVEERRNLRAVGHHHREEPRPTGSRPRASRSSRWCSTNSRPPSRPSSAAAARPTPPTPRPWPSSAARKRRCPTTTWCCPNHLQGTPGPVVRRGDDEWFAIVKWVIFALIEAEEYGITQANLDR